MSEGSASPAPSTNILRNIIVGVTTTVLGSSAIYFLGFNHKGGGGSTTENILVTKEFTTKAWKSYVTSENIYTKNSISLMKELQETKKLDDFEENILQESDKFISDMNQLMKDDNIDGDFISMIKRRIQNENVVIPKTKAYLGNIRSIINSNLSQTEKTEKLAAADKDWATYSKGITERSITDIEDLAKTLSERYMQPFAMTDLLIYKMIKNQGTNNTTTDPGNENNLNKGNNENPLNGQNSQPVAPDANNISNTSTNPANNNNAVDNNYNNPVKNNSGTTVTKSMLTGDWSTNGAEIYLYKDGTMEWEVLSTGDNANGTWQFYNNQLYMYATSSKTGQRSTWVFNLSNVSRNAFTMTLSVQPYNTYSLVRMED
ncbi:MAG: hypothetical protein JJE22_17970 [Bacteroidia bacterium]|nr:hypothetical protein [Bacteroidia bacterium]